jgi:hypothetical protein
VSPHDSDPAAGVALPDAGEAAGPLPSWPREDLRLPTRTLSVRHAPGDTPGLPAALYVHGLGGSSLNWTDLMHAM